MGKKKAFVDKKASQRFRLVADNTASDAPEESFIPTQEHLEEQHKYGVFFDDNYDYMQHLRDVNDKVSMKSVDEEEAPVVKAAAKFPPAPFIFMGEPSTGASSSKRVTFIDEDVEKALEGDFDNCEGNLEDDFIQMAGGVVGDNFGSRMFTPRQAQEYNSDEEDDDEEDYDDDGFDDDEESDGMELSEQVERTNQRDIDSAFNKFIDADYHDDQMGELDGDDTFVGGCIEPSDQRLKQLAREKKADPEYDEMAAKNYIRQRMALIESGQVKEDEEEVEVDESARKRMKWDCESFATQYSNIFNHPTLIKDPNTKLSRRALKKLNKAAELADAAAIEEEESMEDDDVSETETISTFRPKGETPEQRKLRKAAIKAARKCRRVEKKMNKTAFAEEHRKVAKARVGQIKATPIV